MAFGQDGRRAAAVLDADGTPLDAAALTDGDRVRVWVGGACAESFPVQCEVAAVQVAG